MEIITNQTASALELLAKQQTQMQAALYQNHLASNCHLHIDDNSQAVTEIATNIRKVAHVPVQVWKGWDPNSLLDGWFSALVGFKTLIGKRNGL
jgi:hypothetical protein